MIRPSESGELTDEESADLTKRVEQFRAAWSPVGATDLSWSLPPRGTHHRLAVLVQIVLTDMERRAAAGLPFRVERYVNLFPDELTTANVPAALLVAEYRLRHRHTDRPALAEYERWFPAQFEAIAEELRKNPIAPPGPDEPTPVRSARPAGSGTDGGMQATRVTDPTPVTVLGDVLPSDTPYRLIRKLGAGAFGEVFEARAPGEIPIAVKRIMRPVDHPTSRSEREALEAIKRLSHPFLLKTNAYWILDDRLVIVMELADGSLSDRIEHYQNRSQSGVPPEELIPLFEQAAKALDYLHSENVSHRDIKPENILILKGYAKVADFGLARPQQHTLTVVGNTVGTPAYMAPEMWREQVSLQSDQYSLAATYVRARVGRTLYAATALVDMGNCHINETPDLSPLPAAEQRVLLRALAKNPDDRFPSCLEFVEALRAAVMPASKLPERRSRVLLTIAGVLVACAVTVALVGVFDPFRGQSKENVVEKEPEKPPVVVAKEPEKPPLITIPAGWTADPGERRLIDGTRYPLKLTRPVGEEATLVAILISPTNPGDPPPFYLLENKITNRVFSLLWTEIEADKASDLYRLDKMDRNAHIRGLWTRGSRDYDKAPDEEARWLGITGDQLDVPVSSVTVLEAMIVAKRLGGSLPGFRQWLKATGEMEPAPNRKPPAGDAFAEGTDRDTVRSLIEKRDLALGRSRPLPVTKGSGDVSVWKIRQLVSNGPEWLGQSDPQNDATRIVLSPTPDVEALAVCVGPSYYHEVVFDFTTIRKAAGVHAVTEVNDVHAGFRIVLEPR